MMELIESNPFGGEWEYYTLQEIADILLTDLDIVQETINNKNLWEGEYKLYIENPIIVDDELKYLHKIMRILDKEINVKNKGTYRTKYQNEITNVYFIGYKRIHLNKLIELNIDIDDFLEFYNEQILGKKYMSY